MRIKGVIQYDGSNYYGFQKQENNQISIQEVLEEKLSFICNEKIKIFASGRTDKGVHALGQVFHFDMLENRDIDHLLYALNRLLPRDIYLLSLEKVNEDFHARYMATKKHYRYRVLLKRNVLLVNYTSYFAYEINEELLQQGINLFLGEHEFKNFCSNKEKDSYIRTIYSFEYRKENDEIIFDIIGSGFKRYMVRMIIGTLLSLASKKINLSYIEERLNDKNKGVTIYNAEPQGLYLMEVFYD